MSRVAVCMCVFMPCEGQDDAEEVLPVPQGMSLPLKMDSEVQSFDAALAQDAGLRKALVIDGLFQFLIFNF